MKRLLQLTTLIEVPTGLALIIVPAFVVHLLLRAEISGAGIPLGRLGGTAVLGLGVASWLASYSPDNCASRGVVTAMLIYNIGATLILGEALVHSPLVGVVLGSVVLLHAALAAWCATCLMSRKPHVAQPTAL